MQRRNFFKGTATAAAALVFPTSLGFVAAQQDANTFSDDDTLVERTKKLNALMGRNCEVDVTYPKEWETQRHSLSRDELLGAQFPRLIYDLRHPFQWSVHLSCNGRQCTHDMSPIEFFHWTSATAWWYRANKAIKTG